MHAQVYLCLVWSKNVHYRSNDTVDCRYKNTLGHKNGKVMGNLPSIPFFSPFNSLFFFYHPFTLSLELGFKF